MRFAGLDGAGERVCVHVGEHQHLAGGGGDGDHGHKAVSVESRREDGPFLDLGFAARRSGKDGRLAHRDMSFAADTVSRVRVPPQAS